MSDSKYTAPHMLLHWVIAALVVVQIALAGGMQATFDAKFEGIDVSLGWTSGAIFHAILGTSIGILMIWRLGLRQTTRIPPPPAAPGAIQAIARMTHLLFYALLIGMPLFGAAAWFIPSAPLGAVHAGASKLLIALIALHLAGAAYHHFIAGDTSVLRRMLTR
ncbi:cytochrome b [Loktanella sp. R86503]|uniref:cytochrome b n=1 Tax=Loktanella sp. R86503 TaxID=3093847 RepID=UPI0036DB0BEB